MTAKQIVVLLWGREATTEVSQGRAKRSPWRCCKKDSRPERPRDQVIEDPAALQSAQILLPLFQGLRFARPG